MVPLHRFRVGLLVPALLFLVACSKPVPVEEPIRAVKLITVGAQALESGAEFSGEVRARVESRLGFRVPGKLLRRPVEVGQRVRPGQLLAQLDGQDLRLATDAVRAQLDAAVVQRDLAAAELRRFRDLREQNFISTAELDRREAGWKAANAQVSQLQAQLAGQSNQAGYADLLADVAGVVTAVEAEAGQVLSAGMPVVRIAHDGARDVVFAVPEDRVGAMKAGSAVSVRPWSDARELGGRIREVAALADPVTRTFQVKVALDGAAQPALGSTVTVRPASLSAAAQAVTAIRIPTSALRREGQGSAVWVFDPATSSVRGQAVEVLGADGNLAVIGRGLEPGMEIVAAGVHVLAAGQRVIRFRGQGAEPPAPARAASRP